MSPSREPPSLHTEPSSHPMHSKPLPLLFSTPPNSKLFPTEVPPNPTEIKIACLTMARLNTLIVQALLNFEIEILTGTRMQRSIIVLDSLTRFSINVLDSLILFFQTSFFRTHLKGKCLSTLAIRFSSVKIMLYRFRKNIILALSQKPKVTITTMNCAMNCKSSSSQTFVIFCDLARIEERRFWTVQFLVLRFAEKNVLSFRIWMCAREFKFRSSSIWQK